MVAKAGGNCPCNCHVPEACKVMEPFNHHDCTECWADLIAELYAMEEVDAHFDAVWSILVGVCGASADERDDFIHHALRTRRLEYRFRGNLGFGGKVYMENPPRVSCYREDETPARVAAIDAANMILTMLEL